MLSNTIPSFKPLNLTAKTLTFQNTITPLDLFTPLASQPWSIWLDSGQSQHIDACFDILVWQPEATLSTCGNETHISYSLSNESKTSRIDPLTLVEETQQEILAPSPPSIHNLPFLGGAIGYFSYDLGRRFEKLPKQAKQDIDLPEMAVGIYSQAVIYDHKREEFYLVCPEEKRSELEAFLQQKVEKVQSNNNDFKAFSLTSNWKSNMDKTAYYEKFEHVQQYLTSGDCYQINLAQRFEAQYQGNEFQAYSALRTENKAPFSAFMQMKNASILSMSPERFLKYKQGKVQSKPIKGTMPRSDDQNIDKENAAALSKSIKDRAENLMIVDLLRNDISKVCKPDSVVVPKLFDIESFPAVHHLVSTVEGELNEQFSAVDLLRGAFPGGSITGAPKIRAMEIIEELEPHRRSVYCGSIGYISTCGTMDSSITIRTLICESKRNESSLNTSQQKIYCWAGGGVVADSQASSEFQETLDKVNRILPVLKKLSKHGCHNNG